ncbi:MAG: hypothetical protein RBT41_11185 [Clostridia bacterium]|jgi:hypothetical protein|nr:hypothetical protein [Clostridia bacterium]
MNNKLAKKNNPTSAKIDDKYNQDMIIQTYYNERTSLIEAKLKGAEILDKAMLTLSAGAFGLSFTFVKQVLITIKPVTLKFLMISWIAFCSSLLLTLFSLLLSQFACDKQIILLEKNYFENDTNTNNCLSKLTTWLNVLSIFSFVCGVIILSYFGYINLLE